MPKTAERTESDARPKGDFPHEFTTEERRKGALAKAERMREKREAAERLIIERLADEMDVFVTTHLELRDDSEQPGTVRMAAVKEAYDRVAGKPSQSLEVSGDPDRPVVVEHRDKLSLRDALAKVATRRESSSVTR